MLHFLTGMPRVSILRPPNLYVQLVQVEEKTMSVKDDFAPMAKESLPPKPSADETEEEVR